MSLQPVSRIFGVDDEHIIALSAILQMNGYSAKFYTGPLEALTAARSGASKREADRRLEDSVLRSTMDGGFPLFTLDRKRAHARLNCSPA